MNNVKVLIVDDSEMDLAIFHKVLSDIGYDCTALSDGTKCLERAKELLPDIILLDINMPEISGFDVCSQIKECPETAHINVIFLSANVDVNSVLQGIHVGAMDYLPKPIETPNLIRSVVTRTATESIRKATRCYTDTMKSLAIKYG